MRSRVYCKFNLLNFCAKPPLAPKETALTYGNPLYAGEVPTLAAGVTKASLNNLKSFIPPFNGTCDVFYVRGEEVLFFLRFYDVVGINLFFD